MEDTLQNIFSRSSPHIYVKASEFLIRFCYWKITDLTWQYFLFVCLFQMILFLLNKCFVEYGRFSNRRIPKRAPMTS